MGKRVRRGFGSVRISTIDKQDYKKDFEVNDILDLIESINPGNYKVKDNKLILNIQIVQNYPYVKEIQLGHEYHSWEKLLIKIGKASSACKDPSLGSAEKGLRLASPIFVSVLKKSNNKYLPIVTTLNTAFKNDILVNFDMQNKFKEMII